MKAPTVQEATIQAECRVTHTLGVPLERTVYVADVDATTVHAARAAADRWATRPPRACPPQLPQPL